MKIKYQMLLWVVLFLLSACKENSVKNITANTDSFKELVSDFEDKDRVIWQKPDLVIKLLGDIQNQTVADIGAGTGYFAFRLIDKSKKVIAVDIDKRFINFMDSIKAKLPDTLQQRFVTRLALPDNPKLEAKEADAILIVNTYCYIENRVDYLKKLIVGLSDTGKIIIIDFKKKNIPVGPPPEAKLADSEVENELQQAGFKKVQIDENTLDYQYIVTATKL